MVICDKFARMVSFLLEDSPRRAIARCLNTKIKLGSHMKRQIMRSGVLSISRTGRGEVTLGSM